MLIFRSKLQVLALAALLAGLTVQAATADVIVYDNLGAANTPPGGGSDFVSVGVGALADSFSVAGAGQLTDVKVLLNGSPVEGASSTVQLFSDLGTSPGVLLTTVGTVDDSSLTSSPTVFDFPLGTPYPLSGGRYWIQISTSTESGASWNWSKDISGTGVAGEFFANSYGVHPNIGGPYQMQVSIASPEPAACLLGAIAALGALAFLRRRPRHSG